MAGLRVRASSLRPSSLRITPPVVNRLSKSAITKNVGRFQCVCESYAPRVATAAAVATLCLIVSLQLVAPTGLRKFSMRESTTVMIPASAVVSVASPSHAAPWQSATEQRPHVPDRTLAGQPFELPATCLVRPNFEPLRDRDCYVELERRFLEDAAANPTAPFCWGYASSNVSKTLYFHTIALTSLPATMPLIVNSFLATQCCDAVLWIWVNASVIGSAAATSELLANVPPHHAARIVVRTLDINAEFLAVQDDFPDINASSVAAMLDPTDVRFRANWARLLVLYAYGGVYVDLDTMFLRDYRPLLAAAPAFTYKAGDTVVMNIAVLRMQQRPNRATRDLVAAAVNLHAVSQADLSHIMRLWMPETSRWHLEMAYVSMLAFDVLWPRFLASMLAGRPDADRKQLATQTREMMDRYEKQGALFTAKAHWNAFFMKLPLSDFTAMAMSSNSSALFFPGSFSYHWHNRCV